MSDHRERGFDIQRDLRELLAMVGRARATSDPHAFLHPGGLQWLLRRLGRDTFAVRSWMTGDALAGFAIADAGHVMVVPSGLALEEHLALIDVERALAAQEGADVIEVTAWEQDRTMLAALAERGFEVSATYGHELVRTLVDPLPAPALPAGFGMRWLEPGLDASYVELHRAAWMRNGVPSSYTRQMHDIVVTMPDFRRELGPIVSAPDGRLAAYCIAWFDPRTGTTEIEPLGTHPEFRRLGLGRAIVNEVFRRSAEHRASLVMVWGAPENDAAFRLYTSAGMRSRRVARQYRCALGR
jgi:ribosomal protein S18 acetylase RimI-like enzyme